LRRCSSCRIKTDGPAFDVSGIIGLSGDAEGSVVLSFPMTTAQRVVSLMTGVEVTEANEDLCDAVGELVNMIAGGTKAQLQGRNISISCPSVVVGANHAVYGRKDVACVCIPCGCDCGDFTVEIAMKKASSGAQTASAGSSAAA